MVFCFPVLVVESEEMAVVVFGSVDIPAVLVDVCRRNPRLRFLSTGDSEDDESAFAPDLTGGDCITRLSLERTLLSTLTGKRSRMELVLYGNAGMQRDKAQSECIEAKRR